MKSLLDFGALGDGITDDTEAISKALAEELCLEIPPQHFRISAPLVIRTGHVLRGLGRANYAANPPQSRFVGPWFDWAGPPDGTMMKLFSVESVLVENLGLYGGMDRPGASITCLSVGSDNNPSTWQITLLRCVFAGALHGITWGSDGQQESDMSKISECDFRNCFSTGISIRGVNSLDCSKISDSRFMGCQEACIRVHSSGTFTVSGCAGGTSGSSSFLEFAGFTGSVHVEGSQSEGGGYFIKFVGAEDNPQITLSHNVINDKIHLNGIVRLVDFGNMITAPIELIHPGARILAFGDRPVNMPGKPLIYDPYGKYNNLRQPYAGVYGEYEYNGEYVYMNQVPSNVIQPVPRTGKRDANGCIS